jgi:hypothetical protein
MAMTKAERAEYDRAIAATTPLFPAYPCPEPLTESAIKALPKVAVPNKWNKATTVNVTPVWFVNVYNAEKGYGEVATLGAADGSLINRREVAQGDSRGGGPMFATELDALQYVRHQIALACVVRLANADKLVNNLVKEALKAKKPKKTKKTKGDAA